MKKRYIYSAFALWYTMFLLSAISDVSYVYISTNYFSSLPRNFAIIIALVILISFIYIQKNMRLSTMFLCLVLSDIFFSVSIASRNDYGKYFWENISSIFSFGDIVSYHIKEFLKIFGNDTERFTYFTTGILTIVLGCKAIKELHPGIFCYKNSKNNCIE